MQGRNEKGETIIYKALHILLMIEQHKTN